ncbi:MAG: DUF1573 domain-containing protein [Chthoniobacterales bacterium]
MRLNPFIATCLGILLAWSSAQAQTQQVPANDNFANREVIYGTNHISFGNNVLATTETNDRGYSISSVSHTVWWSWTAPVDGVVTIDTNGSSFDTTMAVFTGNSLSNLFIVTEVQGNQLYFAEDDDAGIGLASLVTFTAQAGVTYQISIDGFVGNIGFIELNLAMKFTPPSNDNFANRQVVNGAGATISATNVGGTREFGEPNHAGNAGGESLWYSWTAPRTGLVQIKSTGTNFDTILGVYVGDGLGALFDASSSANSGVINSTPNELDFKVIGGETYAIAVDGMDGRVGSFTLTVAQGPAISLSGVLNYGSRKVKSKTTLTLKIVNTGTTTLKIRGIDCPSGYEARYSGSLAPGRSKSVRVIFSPNRKGTFNSYLTVRSNAAAGNNKRRLTGTGY